MIRFSIPYPSGKKQRSAWCREFGLNAIYSGKHWAARKNDAVLWHALTIGALNKAGINHLFVCPVSISFLWNDRLDLSNHAYMAKMIEDALKGRVIVDDSKGFVDEIHHLFWDKDEIGVVVEELK